MSKLQSFDDFTRMQAEKAQAENLAKQTQVREESARSFKDLLSEYGVTKVSELTEEQRTEFFTRLEGTGVNESLSLVTEGTRSFFGKIDKKGDVTAVYMHYDGYPENMLPLIKKGYNGAKAKNIDVVLQNGAGSGLEADPSKINYYNDNDAPLSGNIGTPRDIIGAAKQSWAEFVYLYDERDRKWYMADTYEDNDFKPAFESVVNESKEEDIAYDIMQDLLGEHDPWDLVDMLPEEALDTVEAYGHKGSKAKKIADILLAMAQSGTFESVVNEGALSISGLRTAKKVLTQYNQILNSKFNAIGQGGDKKSILGAVKYLFWNAMEDANFSREANAIMNNIKGGINTVMVPVEGLGGLMATVGATQIKRALDEEFNRISNAADWSGIGIVEGTALYLEQLGEATVAAKLLADFNAQFESKEVMEARIAEGNAFGDAVRKAKEAGEKEFEFQGKTYKVEENKVRVNEAEIKSDEEFKEYAFTVLKKAFGDKFDEDKGQQIVDGILSKADGDYGAAVGMLTSSLG